MLIFIVPEKKLTLSIALLVTFQSMGCVAEELLQITLHDVWNVYNVLYFIHYYSIFCQFWRIDSGRWYCTDVSACLYNEGCVELLPQMDRSNMDVLVLWVYGKETILNMMPLLTYLWTSTQFMFVKVLHKPVLTYDLN